MDLIAHQERQEGSREDDCEGPQRRDAEKFAPLGTGKCCRYQFSHRY